MNTSAPAYYRSKTIATWLAVVTGALGLHRLYVYGPRQVLGWLHGVPTAVGYLGVLRWQSFGVDDRLGAYLVPVLGLMLCQGMLHGIYYGLMRDALWDERFNPGHPPRATAWGPILGVIAGLLVGAAILMGVIAFTIQKFFEWQ